MNKIKLIKSTFLREQDTKERLCNFIKDACVLSMGSECRKFEEKFSLKQGVKYSVFVTNGSCANLLLIQVMLNMGKLKKDDKVFISGLTWATNIMPIIQLGLVPILIDVEKETFNVSSNILKKSYENNKDIKCLFLTNALGFCSDIDNIKKFCEEKDILFLEDNCESLGSEYKQIKLGNFGLASTFSFFVGHHISTIEGGMICTNDEDLYENLKLARAHGWTRNNSNKFKENMKSKFSINNFYNTYAFYDLAYNFRPTEINGFIGNLQINYWDEIVNKRECNFNKFNEAALTNDDILKLKIDNLNIVSNFGFPLLFRDKIKFEKYRDLFIKNEIEIRPIIGGDISKQPFFRKWVDSIEDFPNISDIHVNGFYFGNNPEMNDEEIGRIVKLLKVTQ